MDGWRDPLQALQAYETWLARQPLSSRTRGEYVRWVRLFCGWLQDGADERALGADPLADLAARDYAARDFKRFLKSERALGPASVNLALAAVDHLYRQLGLGRANVRRESLPVAAPRALSRDEQRALLRAAERAGARDRALVVLMLFAGLRIGETVALDVDETSATRRPPPRRRWVSASAPPASACGCSRCPPRSATRSTAAASRQPPAANCS